MYKIISLFFIFSNFFCNFLDNKSDLKSGENSKINDFYYDICTTEYSVFNQLYSRNPEKLFNLLASFLISKDEIKNILEIFCSNSFDLLNHDEQFFLQTLKTKITNCIKRMEFFKSSIFEKMSVSEKLKLLKAELYVIERVGFFEEDVIFIRNKIEQLNSNKPTYVFFPEKISGKPFFENLKKFFGLGFGGYSFTNSFDNNSSQKNIYIYKSLFWYFYLQANLKKKNQILPNHNDESVLKFFLTIPIFLKNTDKNFSKIELYESIKTTFSFKTKVIGATALYKEILPLYVNKKMAKDIIERRTLFIELINNDDEFKEKLEKIITKFASLINDEKFIQEKKFLEDYIQKFIPPRVDFMDWGGRNSLPFYYFLWGLRQQWIGPIHMLMDLKEGVNDFNRLNSTMTSPEIKELTKNNNFLTNQLVNNPYLKQIPIGRLLFPVRSLDSLSSKGEKVYTITDAFKERNSFLHGLSKYFIGFSMDGWKFLETNFVIKNIYKSSRSINYYFNFLKELIALSKETYNLIEDFYKKKNIPKEMIVPEILNCKEKIFDKNKLLNFLSSWNSGFKEKIKSWFNIIFPGNISRFYLKNIENNYEIFENIGGILGCVDAALAKATAVKNSNDKNPFSLVKISDSDKSFLEIENMWFPATNDPVSNDFSLNDDQRNTFIVSPVAAGKSTTLATILNLLYFANCGVVTAKKLFYTYYKYIVPSLMGSDYIIGSGTSGHLYEYENFQKIDFLSKICGQENENMICFFDEVYNTTNSDDVYYLAKETFRPILKNEKINTIITTHNPELLNLAKFEDFKLGIKYIEIIYDKKNKIFDKTFKIKNNDENNWWIEKDKRLLRLEYTNFAYKNKLPPTTGSSKENSYKGNFSFSDFFIL